MLLFEITVHLIDYVDSLAALEPAFVISSSRDVVLYECVQLHTTAWCDMLIRKETNLHI